jgi:hypothetical protein
MAKFTIKIDDRDVKRLVERLQKNPINADTQRTLGASVINAMKAMIERGQSPIKGERRFKPYRGSYRDNIKKKKFKGKRLRPVNLKLTGKFLRSLKHKVKPGGVFVGYFNPLSKKKEQGHREEHNLQEFRPTIPDRREKEEFAVRVQKVIFDVINARVKDVIE